MPLEIRPDDDGRILHVLATGAGEAAEWIELTEAQALDGDTRRFGLLMDVRPRESLPDEEGARALGALMSRWGAVAIVSRPGAQFGVARTVDIIGELGGTRVQSFTELNEARTWLLEQIPWRFNAKSR